MTSKKNTADGLSDEQFCALLMGSQTGKPDAGEAAEAASLKDALRSYRTETLLWAERRSAAMPSLTPAARRSGVWSAVPQWSLAAVAVMTVAIGMAHFHNASQETATVETPAAITRAADVGVATPEQVANDNALLSSIDAAVNAGSGLPVTALGLESAHAVRAHGSME